MQRFHLWPYSTLTKGGQGNAVDDPSPYVAQSAANGLFRTIYVCTVPAELIMIRGSPSYEPIAGLSIPDVTNTDDNIIVNLDQDRPTHRAAVRDSMRIGQRAPPGWRYEAATRREAPARRVDGQLDRWDG